MPKPKREVQMHKFIVIGLDGACFDVMDPLIEQGKLPTLQRLIQEGVKGDLRSTIPPMTAAAWTSFMTGKSPGKHGVFDFRNFDLSSYTSFDESFITSSVFAGSTLFDILGNSGHKVAAIRVPVTYPTWKINGAMVSGYPSPPRGKSRCYPSSLEPVLEKLPVISIDKAVAGSPQKQAETAAQIIESEMRLVSTLIDELEFDFLMFVSGLPDVAHHRFWRFSDPSSPVFPGDDSPLPLTIISDFYEKLDVAVAAMLEKLGDDITLVIMSDHGGGPRPGRALNLNAWLANEGLLSRKTSRTDASRQKFGNLLARTKGSIPFKETIRRLLPNAAKAKITGAINLVDMVNWPETSAYRVPLYHPIDGINLNVNGRQAEGRIEPGQEYEDMRSLIIEKLSALRDPETGERVVEQVSRKEDVYQGSKIDNVPDIIVIRNQSYDGGPGFDDMIEKIPESSLNFISGLHTLDGIFIGWGDGFEKGKVIEGARIIDLAPTILKIMDVPIPEDMDGIVLSAALDESVNARSVSGGHGEAETRAATVGDDLSEEEREQIRKELEGLGYV